MDGTTAAEIKKTTGYRQVFKQKEFMKLVIANVINRFGDSLDSIAFTWMVYSLTNSPAWSAIIFGINRIPTIFLQPFAGAMVENRNKKMIMVFMDVIRGISVSFIAILYILKLLNPWIILIMTLVISTAEAFREPAGNAVLPKILDKDYFEFGLSLNSTLSNVVELAGLAVAGAIIGLFGIQTAVFMDGATFWGSAFIILFIQTGEEKIPREKINIQEYFHTLQSGFSYTRKNRIIMNFIMLAMVTNGILVPLNSLMAPLVKDMLKQDEYMLSVISFSLSTGMITGSAFYPYAAQKLKNRTVICLGGIILGLYYLSFVISGKFSNISELVYAICITASFITGNAVSFLTSTLRVQFMKQVDMEYMARVSAIMNSGCVCIMPVVSFAVSILTVLLPISVIFLIVGSLGIAFFAGVRMIHMNFE
ncbi:MAG: MFS transporter [Lachnoclostridium sp.]|jgi:Na+/melibiose symporter-like transporter